MTVKPYNGVSEMISKHDKVKCSRIEASEHLSIMKLPMPMKGAANLAALFDGDNGGYLVWCMYGRH
ncbi:hypothetical protein BLOT_003820 [Blomia tropicalis]|nr:hypothetical protein BLOT_003820 [Blomia tropicalis]